MKGKAISGPMFDLIGEVRRQDPSEERIKKLNESGILAMLLKANLEYVDKDAIARALGLNGPPQSMQIAAELIRDEPAKDVARALSRAAIGLGYVMYPWAELIFDAYYKNDDRRHPLPGPSIVQAVIVSTEQLGLSSQFTLPQVFEAGSVKGLKKCIPDNAVSVRVGYRNQPYREDVRVAMDPIRVEGVGPIILRLGCNDESGLMIDGMCGDLDRTWDVYPHQRKVYFMFIDTKQ